jgi:hypothetical protein
MRTMIEWPGDFGGSLLADDIPPGIGGAPSSILLKTSQDGVELEARKVREIHEWLGEWLRNRGYLS